MTHNHIPRDHIQKVTSALNKKELEGPPVLIQRKASPPLGSWWWSNHCGGPTGASTPLVRTVGQTPKVRAAGDGRMTRVKMLELPLLGVECFRGVCVARLE